MSKKRKRGCDDSRGSPIQLLDDACLVRILTFLTPMPGTLHIFLHLLNFSLRYSYCTNFLGLDCIEALCSGFPLNCMNYFLGFLCN